MIVTVAPASGTLLDPEPPGANGKSRVIVPWSTRWPVVSSSVIVTVPLPSAIVAFTGLERSTKKVSSGSTRVSPTISTAIVRWNSPGPKKRKSSAGLKSPPPAVAVPSRVSKATVTRFVAGDDRLTWMIASEVPEFPSVTVTSSIDSSGVTSSSVIVNAPFPLRRSRGVHRVGKVDEEGLVGLVEGVADDLNRDRVLELPRREEEEVIGRAEVAAARRRRSSAGVEGDHDQVRGWRRQVHVDDRHSEVPEFPSVTVTSSIHSSGVSSFHDRDGPGPIGDGGVHRVGKVDEEGLVGLVERVADDLKRRRTDGIPLERTRRYRWQPCSHRLLVAVPSRVPKVTVTAFVAGDDKEIVNVATEVPELPSVTVTLLD